MDRLRLLRDKIGITQQELAYQIGSSQQNIQRYESGSNEPDIQTLRLLADFFDTSVDYLIGHTDIPHKIEPVQPWELNAAEASPDGKIPGAAAPGPRRPAGRGGHPPAWGSGQPGRGRGPMKKRRPSLSGAPLPRRFAAVGGGKVVNKLYI